jgi:hypothetical protein
MRAERRYEETSQIGGLSIRSGIPSRSDERADDLERACFAQGDVGVEARMSTIVLGASTG